jgi:hypothetical protein
MFIKDENRAKELLIEAIESDYVDLIPGVGINYDDVSIEYDVRYTHLTENEDYPLIKRKIKRIFKLINNDPSLVDADIETDLWYRV